MQGTKESGSWAFEKRKKEDKPEPEKKAPRRGKLRDLSASSLIANYPALAPYEKKLTSLHDLFVQAIKKSTEANVSFKMQLQMVLKDHSH